MSLSRRTLLQYTGAGCALAMLPSVSAASALRRYEVRDAVALPRFRAGAVVIADTLVNRFAGDGLYLYPAWGQPRLYEVRAAVGRLEFRSPGARGLLWTQSAELDATFAGKVLEDRVGAAHLPALSVPALPQRAGTGPHP